MRVAIDAGVIGSGRGGDETYMRNLLRGLALVAPKAGHQFLIYLSPKADVPAEISKDSRFEVRRLSSLPSAARYALELPLRVGRERPLPDLLLTTNHAPIVSAVPGVVLVHDLSFRHHPEHYTRLTRARLNWLVPLHIRQARLVITVSEFSRADLISSFDLPEGAVRVVPNAVLAARPDTHGLESLRARGVGARFFLYLGNLHPRKNIVRLIEAYGRARERSSAVAGHHLVIAGAATWMTEEITRLAASYPGLVVVLGRIDDAERDALLANATALTYVSLFEGFGLPPLEAMAAGTPVLTSSASAMPEVVGQAALLVDPLDVDAIAAGIARLAEEPELRSVLRERGLARAATYSLERTGEEALAAFEAARLPRHERLLRTAS